MLDVPLLFLFVLLFSLSTPKDCSYSFQHLLLPPTAISHILISLLKSIIMSSKCVNLTPLSLSLPYSPSLKAMLALCTSRVTHMQWGTFLPSCYLRLDAILTYYPVYD